MLRAITYFVVSEIDLAAIGPSNAGRDPHSIREGFTDDRHALEWHR